jgi:hypothetical protein
MIRITCALIAINRFMLVGQEHRLIFKKISEIKIRRGLAYLVIFSSIVSLASLFQYEINIDYELYEYPMIRVFHSVDSSALGTVLITFIIIQDILNYFFFMLVNTVVDIIIVYKLRKELKENKGKHLSNVVVNASRSDNIYWNKLIAETRSANLHKTNKKYNKKEMKALVMVILNGVLNFMLRLHEMSLLVYYIFFYYFA